MFNPANPKTYKDNSHKPLKIFLTVLASITSFLGLIILIIGLTGYMKPVIGIILATILILPILIIMINKLSIRRKKLGHLDRTSWWLLATVIIILVILFVSLVYIIIYGQGCQGRVGPGASLNGCNLSGQDFSGIDLSHSSIRYANLEQADFSNADLTGVDFTGSNFMGADLGGAILSDVTFNQARLLNVTGLSDEQLANTLNVPLVELYSVTAQKQIQLEERAQILDTLKYVCDDQAVPTAHQYDGERSFHTIVIFDSTGDTIGLSNTALLNSWEPMAVRFADLVACVGDEVEEIIQTCPYTGGSSIERLAYSRGIRVLEAQTGRVVEETIFEGEIPDECPEYASESQTKIKGKDVPNDQIIEWLENIIYTGSE